MNTPLRYNENQLALISNSARDAMALARAFPFERYLSLTGLGGAGATLLAPILEEHPHLSGTVFETADLHAAAEKYLLKRGLLARTGIIAGNFMESVVAGSELYLVKNCLWNFDDSDCLTVIKNVRNAIGTARNSRFLMLEYLMEQYSDSGVRWPNQSILTRQNIKVRTASDYARLLARTGFVLDRVQYLGEQTLMIARPF